MKFKVNRNHFFNGLSSVTNVVGSRATMLYYADLRTAGAQVRKVMLQNAAERWGVDASTLRTTDSMLDIPQVVNVVSAQVIRDQRPRYLDGYKKLKDAIKPWGTK